MNGNKNKTVKGDIYMTVDQEADALLKKWNAQQSMMQGMNPNQQGGDPNMGTDQSPHLSKEGVEPTSPDQTPVDPTNSARPMDFSIKPSQPTVARDGMALTHAASVPGGAPTPAQMPDACKQCGTMHPPVAAGQKCPLASVSTEPSKSAGLDDVTVNKHLVEMRNIIITQISSKGIKDGKKFFQYAIIELVKVLEAYNE